jgi:hypothetical protein
MPIKSSDRLALAEIIELTSAAISFDAVWTWILETGMDGELAEKRHDALVVARETGQRLEGTLGRLTALVTVLLRVTLESPISFEDGARQLLEVEDLPKQMRQEVEGWVGAQRTARLIRENLTDVSELLPAELNTIRNKLDTFEARGWTEGDLSQRMKCRIYIAGFGAALPIFPPASIPFGIAFIQNCL